MAWEVRAARAEGLPAFGTIEMAADALFAAYGLPDVADDPPAPLAELRPYQQDGRAWVVGGGKTTWAGCWWTPPSSRPGLRASLERERRLEAGGHLRVAMRRPL